MQQQTPNITDSPVSQQPAAIFLMGPTASGKTDLAIELCDRLNCHIISVDSALIYRGLNIGSAKPEPELLQRYPHELIDIRDPSDAYSVAEFRDDALALMERITASGKIPLLVGGTMMYYRSLLYGMANMPSADPVVRQQIEADANNYGWPYVHQQLTEVDPESAARIHPNDPQRLQRALEVFRVSGKTMTQLHREQHQPKPPSASQEIDQQEDQANNLQTKHANSHNLAYNVCQIALAPSDRKILHNRIEQRFVQMVESGFVDEVRGLMQRGDLNASLPAIRAVGYRQVWEYLDGQYDYDTMLHKGIVATRQLAKRQLTWLRGWSDLHWLYTDKISANGLNLVDESLKLLQHCSIYED